MHGRAFSGRTGSLADGKKHRSSKHQKLASRPKAKQAGHNKRRSATGFSTEAGDWCRSQASSNQSFTTLRGDIPSEHLNLAWKGKGVLREVKFLPPMHSSSPHSPLQRMASIPSRGERVQARRRVIELEVKAQLATTLSIQSGVLKRPTTSS
mgnify:FL=1